MVSIHEGMSDKPCFPSFALLRLFLAEFRSPIAIQSVASFKGDLASLSAPPFLLSPESICQFSQYFNDHPSLLVAPAKEASAEKRALLVMHWYLGGLRRQMATRNEDGTRRKLKPLNPFLGEIFLGKWEDDSGTTELVSEQVSHHPPQTAYRIWNKNHGVSVRGQSQNDSRLQGLRNMLATHH